MTISTVDVPHCPNCGAQVEEAFCASCGQKAGPLNPSLRDLLHTFVEEALNIDGKIAGVYALTTGGAMLRSAAVGIAYMVFVLAALIAIVVPLGVLRDS